MTPPQRPGEGQLPDKRRLLGRRRQLPSCGQQPHKDGQVVDCAAFFCPAGARFTVIRLTGNLAPQFFTAARTRSRASRTAASGRPTMSKAGSPPERKHSALTAYPAMPFSPRERTVTTINDHLQKPSRSRLPPAAGRADCELSKTAVFTEVSLPQNDEIRNPGFQNWPENSRKS